MYNYLASVIVLSLKYKGTTPLCCDDNASMAEPYGLGDPLFDSPDANIEYAPDVSSELLGTDHTALSSSTGSAVIE